MVKYHNNDSLLGARELLTFTPSCKRVVEINVQ